MGGREYDIPIPEVTGILSSYIIEYARDRHDSEKFGSGQQCAREGFHILVDILNSPTLENLFTHRYEHSIYCNNCNNVVSTKREEHTIFEVEPDLIINTDFDTKRPVEMTEFLKKTGSVTHDYKCPKCGDTSPKMRTSKLTMVPEILVVMAKKYRVVNGRPSKIHINTIFPAALTFPGVTNSRDTTLVFSAVASIEHSGGTNGGHYWETVCANVIGLP